MKQLSQRIGVITFWLSWPLLFIYLRGSERTRILLVSGKQVLLVRSWYGSGTWSLPGGGLHVGENHVQGVLRELEEETGLKLPANQLKPLTSSMYHDRGLSFKCHYFVASLPQPVEVQTRLPEIIAAEWMDYQNLSNISLGADASAALEAWTGRNLLQ